MLRFGNFCADTSDSKQTDGKTECLTPCACVRSNKSITWHAVLDLQHGAVGGQIYGVLRIFLVRAMGL
jgi:hypothetical protein